MAQLATATLCVTFLLLGTNYLLPFNTLINLYDFYANETTKLPISPSLFISILNAVYQLTSISTNTAILNIKSSSNSLSAKCAYLCCTATMLLLSFLITMKLTGDKLCVALLLGAVTSSASQSILDNVNLWFIQWSLVKKGVLAYGCGVNVSGTVHSLILICLQLVTINNLNLMSVLYFAITGIIIAAIGSWGYFYVLPRLPNRDILEEMIHPQLSLEIFKTCVPSIILAFLNFTLTLFIFPQLTLRRETPLPNFMLFNTVFVFFLFNASALLGNFIAYKQPCCSFKILWPLLALRIILSCSFFICYHNDILFMLMRTHIPAWLFTVIFSFAIMVCALGSAYISSCSFYIVTRHRSLTSSDKVVGLKLVNLAVSIGLSVGAGLSYLYIYIF